MLLTDQEISQRIAERRTQQGLSIEDLSARADVPNELLHEVETARATLPAQALVSVADALGIAEADLLRDEASSAAPLFRATGEVDDQAIAAADRMIDDFFALEALTSR